MIKNKIKLCIISQGGSVHLRRALGYLAARNYDVYLLTEEPSEVPGITEFLVKDHVFDLPRLRLVARLIFYRRMLRRIKPDILHIICVHPYNAVAALLGFHPLVITAWGADILPEQGALKAFSSRLLLRLAIYRADHVIGVSQEIKSLLDQKKKKRTPSHLIKFGVDHEVFNENETAGSLAKKTGNADEIVVFCPRALTPIYNIDVVVEAFRLVLLKHKKAKLVLKSYGSGDDADYLSGLKASIKKAGMSDSVSIIDGWLTERELADIYKSSDLVISIPSSDGMPTSVLEAMACGVPVIASDLPSMKEIIVPGENGFLVPVRQVEKLASTIISFIENKGNYSQYGARCAAFTRQEADHQLEMKKIEALYNKIGAEGTL
ncbi:MAG: glycosyltransferase family 4 protein [Candidatus Margulisbacteria bacterium]|nr:glycosyltransferase family 4 protein [Candidatus Margulisiibacteriota bacterium]